MPNLRLKIDLSDFFQDQRRLAYVWRNSDWDYVEQLEEHVQRMFDVPKVHFMTEDEVFLPSRESIKVVKDCGLLKAFMAKRLRKRIATEQETDGSADEVATTDQAKQRVTASISSSTPNGPIKKKRRTSMDLTIKAPHASGMGKYPVTSTNNSCQQMEKSSPELSKSAEETVKARKRKRTRKKKKNSSPPSPRLSCVPVPITSSTLRPSMNGSTPNGKHVHFNGDDATLVLKDAETKGRRLVFKSHIAELDPLVAREIAAEESPQKVKPEIVIHENIVLVPATESFVEDCENSSVIEIDDSILKAPTEQEVKDANADSSASAETVEQMLPDSVPLEDGILPKTGDVILFKLPQTAGESTEYICGRCIEVDPVYPRIKCTITDGLDQIEKTRLKCKEGGNTLDTSFYSFLDVRVLPTP